MFLVYRTSDYDGKLLYKQNCIIGVYTDMTSARNDLIKQLSKLKYDFETEFDSDDYFFARCTHKNGIEIYNSPVPCFEIAKKKLPLNTIKFSS